MRRRVGVEQRIDRVGDAKLSWVKWLMVAVGSLVIAGLGVKEWRESQVVGHREYRFNLVMIEEEMKVTFVSIDPTEESIMSLVFPQDLAIKSRTSGEYSISSLYKLGAYREQGGQFTRQKIQGFMRVPIPGHLVITNPKDSVRSNLRSGLLKTIFGKTDSSLSRFDAILLLSRTMSYRQREIAESELVRAGVIDGKTYQPERLQDYVGSRLFDWEIGTTRPSVAILNASGENGLGSDMADFLTNLGLDVVMVRSSNQSEQLEVSEWQVDDEDSAEAMKYIFEGLFDFDPPKVEQIPGEYRAKVLIKVGLDALELF